MALNGGGRGFGFNIFANDQASPVLNGFLSKVSASPQMFAPMMSSLGRLGGAFGTVSGTVGGATGAVGGMVGALGPLALAIGAVVAEVMLFKTIADKANETIKMSIDRFASYEKGLAEVTTIIRGTREEMDDLGQTALKMSTTFGTSVEQQLKGTYQTASAGFADAADAVKIMDTANRLAVAGVTDVASSVTLLAQIINGFSLQVEDANTVSDALFKTVEKGVTTVPQLAGAFGKVVPSAAAAGASLDETLGALAALTRGGLSTAEAVTALARMFDFLTKKPPAAMKVMEEYGVDLDNLNIRQVGVLNAMKEMGKAFEGHEEQLIKAVPQIRAFRAAVNLSGNQLGTFEGILGDLENKMGATEAAFQTQAKTLDFQRRRWAAFIDSLKVKLGSVFAPVIGVVMGFLEKLMNFINEMPMPLQKVVLGLTAVALAIPVVVMAIGTLLVVGGLLFLLLSGTIAVLSGLLIPLAAVAAAFAPLVAAVGVFALAWKTNWLGIRDAVVLAWDKVKLTFQAIAAFIEGGGVISGPLAKELAKAENTGVLKFAGAIYSIWKRIKAVGVAAWEAIKEAIDAVSPVLKELMPSIEPLVEALTGAGDASTDFEKALPVEKFKEFGKAVGDAIGFMIRLGVGLMAFYKRNLEPAVTVLIELFKALWPIIKVTFQALGWVLMNVVVPALKVVVALLTKAWELGKKMGEALGPLFAPIVQELVVPKEGGEAAMPQTSILDRALGAPALAAPPPTGGGGTDIATGAKAGVGERKMEFVIKNNIEMDGDKVGEKMQKYVVDMANREMVPA